MSNPTQQRLIHTVTNRRIPEPERESATQSIYHHMLANSESINGGNFSHICSSDLGLLFQITDEYFFQGDVGRLCEQLALRPLAFRLSTRMTTSGGMTTMFTSKNGKKRGREYEITIATTPLFSSFENESTALVSGIECHDRLEALQRIMEHEMVHLIEMLLWNDSNCSASPFKRIVSQFFAHTASNHQLLTPRDIARKRLGVSPGDLVTFSFEGRHLTGYINRITKRATVLVQTPTGVRYNDGKSYRKYYVPLSRLKRA